MSAEDDAGLVELEGDLELAGIGAGVTVVDLAIGGDHGVAVLGLRSEERPHVGLTDIIGMHRAGRVNLGGVMWSSPSGV